LLFKYFEASHPCSATPKKNGAVKSQEFWTPAGGDLLKSHFKYGLFDSYFDSTGIHFRTAETSESSAFRLGTTTVGCGRKRAGCGLILCDFVCLMTDQV
jgi:hypothetical protein